MYKPTLLTTRKNMSRLGAILFIATIILGVIVTVPTGSAWTDGRKTAPWTKEARNYYDNYIHWFVTAYRGVPFMTHMLWDIAGQIADQIANNASRAVTVDDVRQAFYYIYVPSLMTPAEFWGNLSIFEANAASYGAPSNWQVNGSQSVPPTHTYAEVNQTVFYTADNLTCTNFNVSVYIQNVTSMWSFAMKLGYNASMLEAVRVYSGTIPNSLGVYDWVPKNATFQFSPVGPPTINNTRRYTPDWSPLDSTTYAYVWAGFILAFGKSFTGTGEALLIEFHIIDAPPRGTVPYPGYNLSLYTYLDLWETELVDTLADPISHAALDGRYAYIRPQISPTPPVAEFTWTPTVPRVNETVTFNASASTPDGGNLTDPDSYAWDFGDNTTGTGMIADHQYTTAGNHTVVLNLTDSEGMWDTVSHVVEIIDLPYATKLRVFPPASEVEIGDTFTIGIIVNNVINLTSFEFKLGYNTTILDVISMWVMWPGSFTNNETAGVVLINASSPFQYPFSGNGTLATVTFNATGFGGTPLNLYGTKLVDFYAESIGHDVIDGYAEVKLHDVAILNVVPAAIGAYPGAILEVTFTVKNKGTVTETFWIAVYFNQTATEWILIGNQTVTDLAGGAEKQVIFLWDTTGVPPHFADGKYDIYTFNATASTHPMELYTADNVLVDGIVELRIFGDVNGNGVIDLGDLGKMILIYSGIIPEPYYPPNVPDLNLNGEVDLGDLGKMILIYSGIIP